MGDAATAMGTGGKLLFVFFWQCGPGGSGAGFRTIPAVTNLQFRTDPNVDCCGSSCCSEVVQLQLALNGIEFVPSMSQNYPAYVKVQNNVRVLLTMYADPVLKQILPPAVPLQGAPVTVIGANFISASKPFAARTTVCVFGRLSSSFSSLEWVKVHALYLNDTALVCTAPPSLESVSSQVFVSLNWQDEDGTDGLDLAYFSIAQLSPPFGGILGETLVNVTVRFLSAMEAAPGSAHYACQFSWQDSVTVPATLSAPSSLLCLSPAAPSAGPVLVRVTLDGVSFSLDNPPAYFMYHNESQASYAEPDAGPLDGGYPVRIYGSYFVNSSLLACSFQAPGFDVSVRGRDVVYVSSSCVICLAPRSTISGPVRIYVMNNGQQRSITFARMTYFDVLYVEPDGGLVDGGTVVSVTLSTNVSQGWCQFGAVVVQGMIVGGRSETLLCETTSNMSTSPLGSELAFSVSINNRDFATSSFFSTFTFYLAPQVTTLVPEGGPQRGSTVLTVRGNNFFSLCRTGQNPLNGNCYPCSAASPSTFLWTYQSSCEAISLQIQIPRACGLPCRPGKDDRLSFGGTAGQIWCKFGDLKVLARYKSSSQLICISPASTNFSKALRIPCEVSFNDQQYSNDAILFSYYEITSLTPTSGPTYGDTVISIAGQNLFAGQQIACMFWINIVMQGTYDIVNDIILCPTPEQPVQLLDNDLNYISFTVTLNRMIADQYTTTALTFMYYLDSIQTSMSVLQGPMHGGFTVFLFLPFTIKPSLDYLHQTSPYKYSHVFSQTFLNTSGSYEQPAICFGTILARYNSALRITQTCCDDPTTTALCDGWSRNLVAEAMYLNGSAIKVISPSVPYPLSCDVEISWNGFTRPIRGTALKREYNPTAQYTRRAYCDPSLLRCMQQNHGQICETNLDCDNLVFRFWGIIQIFPVTASVKGGTNLDVDGNNFPYPSSFPGSTCVFFRVNPCNLTVCPATVEFARTNLYPVASGCDPCLSFDPDGGCLTVRYCRTVTCQVPPAPGGQVQQIVVEIYYPGYPMTDHRADPIQVSRLFYYLEVRIWSVDITAGPWTGGTHLLINGSGFVNSPSLYCQFADDSTSSFSTTLLWSRATFLTSSSIKCTTPACTQDSILQMNSSQCSACSRCYLNLRVTMNSRDFVDGVLEFWYLPVPLPYSINPKRVPALVQPTRTVTILGQGFSNVGTKNKNGYGLSCKFGDMTVQGNTGISCGGNFTCKQMTCIPPLSNMSGAVSVAVSIDTQQFIPLLLNQSDSDEEFAYYSITGVSPDFFPEKQAVRIKIHGTRLDNGIQYICRFINISSLIPIYSNASLQNSNTGAVIECQLSASGLTLGEYYVSVSLDAPQIEPNLREYTQEVFLIRMFQQSRVTSLFPTKGKRVGGQFITVVGYAFRNTSLLICSFNGVVGLQATYVNENIVICETPFLPVFNFVVVDVSYNGQDFSHSQTVLAVYDVPEVFFVTPASLPVGCSKQIVITGALFRNFDSLMCLFLNAESMQTFTVPGIYMNASSVSCQAPPCSTACNMRVKVTLDGSEFSSALVTLRTYNIETINPLVGPRRGKTPLRISGQNLQNGTDYVCRFAARDGVGIRSARQNSAYDIVVDSGGHGYSDGTFGLVLHFCSDSIPQVYNIIPSNDIVRSENYGIFDILVICKPPCTGSGLVAVYNNTANEPDTVNILDAGTLYNASHPPTLTALGGKWVFFAEIGTNCQNLGCCNSSIEATYTVFNGSIVTATIFTGGESLSAENPPQFEPNGCDGKGAVVGCKTCQYAVYISSGTCAGSCICNGSVPACSSGQPATTCLCTRPTVGQPCSEDWDCLAGGVCVQSAKLRLLIANVSDSIGTYDSAAQSVVCAAPVVTFPDDLASFVSYLGYTRTGVPATFTGLAPILIKVSLNGGPEFTTRNVIYRYEEFPEIFYVTPNSASSRGGSEISVFGSGFRIDQKLSIYIEQDVTSADSYGPADGDVVLSCRLHGLLPIKPVTFVNSTLVICVANRVCFEDSTMPDCSGCIREGCPQPNSTIFATDTIFSVGVSMNSYDFEDGGITFYVYSITSFRPFGGVYDGGTHVTISGIGFDRGGVGPYNVLCKFSRIVVSGVYDSELSVVKCLSGPLLDVFTVLEIHLGMNMSDDSFYTDNQQIFYYYTAYPGGLSIIPNSGSFRGGEPAVFVVPQPTQYNIFRFKSLDFDSVFEGVITRVRIVGAAEDASGIIDKLQTFENLLFAQWNNYNSRATIALSDLYMDSGTTVDHITVNEAIIALSDFYMDTRTRVNDSAFDFTFRVEPTENTSAVQGQILSILLSSEFRNSFKVETGLACDRVMNISTYSSYSEYGSFARFGDIVAPAKPINITQMQGIIPQIPVDTPSATVPVYFSINGQQFSLQPLDFYFYSVSSVSPFGVPFAYTYFPHSSVQDKLWWIACPDSANACKFTVVEFTASAIITVYGNNFLSDVKIVNNGIIQCMYGDDTDHQVGVIGWELDPTFTDGRIVPGTVNYDQGYVLCEQPRQVILRRDYNDSWAFRRIRVEVSLNGRDFSYSFMNATSGASLALYMEPEIVVNGAAPYYPYVSPIQGGNLITVFGNYFRVDAPPSTVYCLFSEVDPSYGYQSWQKVPAAVMDVSSITCSTPPFSQYGYGYAASTFLQPPQDIVIYITLNNFHWQRIPDSSASQQFEFFDILAVSPTMSAAQFEVGDDRTLTFNPGNFLNSQSLNAYCWWKVPGNINPQNSFVVQGQRTTGSAYVCIIPDWSTIQIDGYPAISKLPCNQSFVVNTDAVCHQDGRLEVPFGVAFVEDISVSTLADFSFGTTFSFYARPKFQDYLPKMGDQVGGTNVNIYGVNFLNLPTLGCKFSQGSTQEFSVGTIFSNSSVIVCVSPPRNVQSTVTLYLTLNGVHWYTCINSDPSCVFAHPFYNFAPTLCCAWQNSITHTLTRLSTYSYAKRPSVSALQPTAAPTRGDTNINVIGNNIIGTVQGSVFSCLIGPTVIKGVFVTDGGLQYLTCLTQPNMQAGQLEVFVSLNQFEWSSNFQLLSVFQPLRAFRIVPSFTVWDNPISIVTIVGQNFVIPQAQVGNVVIRLAEFDAQGLLRWKKDLTPLLYGNSIPDAEAPSLYNGTVSDVMTFQPPQRNPCTQPTARFCEPGVVKAFVSQNDGTEWTWEDVSFAYVRAPTVKTRCYLDYPVDSTTSWCGLEAIAIVTNGIWDVEADPQTWKIPGRSVPDNDRGDCTLANASDFFGQGITSGRCVCTAGDCVAGAYDCGDQQPSILYLGCSIKAAITDVTPRSGPQAGGTEVTIRGFKISKGTVYWCKFGSQVIDASFNQTDGLVRCLAPASQKNGSVEVELSISDTAEWTDSHGLFTFHYFLPPTIMGLEPSLGPASGGTLVRVTAGYTDALLALGTLYRSLDVDQYGVPMCRYTVINGLCAGMYQFGSYTDYGPISPGLENFCVWEPHCRYQLYQQHQISCEFSFVGDGFRRISTETVYLERNVIQCKTPSYALLMNASNGITFRLVDVSVTMNGQVWFQSPVSFEYHAFNNISKIRPEVGPASGGIWVSLIGTGFIASRETVCKFGTSNALGFLYVSSSLFLCRAPASDVFGSVVISVALNGVQYSDAAGLFRYVSAWTINNIQPRVGQEIGGTLITVYGSNFVDSSSVSCKFGELLVRKPQVQVLSSTLITCTAPRSILSRYPWETNKSYSGFVSNPLSCVGHLIPGTTARIDDGWTVCSNCSDCCLCPDCPECRQSMDQCTCTSVLNPCIPNIPIGSHASRSLCLPPEFRCYWAPRQDPTFSQLQCNLLDFTGRLFYPPQPLVLILGPNDFLHPDLALRDSIPFYTSLDGQTWISGCVAYPLYGASGGRSYSDGQQTCITNDATVGNKWTGTFVYTEKYNLTKFKPDIAPLLGGTTITFAGEGFEQTSDIRCKFGYLSLPDFFDFNDPCDNQGNITGVVYNEVPGVFVDPFTVLCTSPAVDLKVHRLGNPPANADGLIVNPVCAPYSMNPHYVTVPTELTINGSPVDYTNEKIVFVFAVPWKITGLSPSKSPTMGGVIITLYGPYFRKTNDIMCKFGDLLATEIIWFNEDSIGCRNPSVNIHQYVNVSMTLDGQTWSEATNASIFEYDGVRNVLPFGENDYGQLGFDIIGARIFSGKWCVGGKTQGFPCEVNSDCPSGSCQHANRTNLNYIPTFLNQLFAHNITSISMGQTHTIIVSSQTYNDTWGTQPRRGVIYTWGGNLVGQLGFGFAGASLQYNLSNPSVLVCASQDTYMLDVRYDSRTVLGLPSNWPASAFQIPTCLKLQDVTSQGQHYVETLVVYNPFYYESVLQVVAGSFHSLALTESGYVYSWGWNNDGQLGMGPLETQTSIPYPSQITYFIQTKPILITRIAAGYAHSVAIATDGTLYTWGNNKYGQLAQGDNLNRPFPTAVSGFTDSQGATVHAQDVSCGLYHCLVLTTRGQVWSFGSNSRGQLGTCSSSPTINDNLVLTCVASPIEVQATVYTSLKPKKVEFPNITDSNNNLLGAPLITKIATGAFHSMAIAIPCATPIGLYTDACTAYDDTAGDLYVWGNNRYGQLGIGTNSDSEYRGLPVLVPALFTISSQCRPSGYVLCIEGQYTDGCCYPASDYALDGVSVQGIGAGSWHTILYLSHKERIGYRRSLYSVERIYSMGNNDEGQLGLGDVILRNTPTMITTNLVKFHDVGGGNYQSLFTQGCPPNDGDVCNNHGLCYEQGICDCYAGYRGFDCIIECDGGAKHVCTSHGNASMAYALAGWRRSVVRAASGHRMRARLNMMFYPYYCSNVNLHATKFGTDEDCLRVCSVLGGTCILRTAVNVTSSDVLNFLNNLVSDFPDLRTAVTLVIEDWPLELFLQGVRQWKYSFEARAQQLTASTQGPHKGLWQEADVVQIVEMIQNRSTCWRSFDCASGCTVINGQTRPTASTSGFVAGPGCRDGWTARIAFNKRIEEIDQAWSNLEEENLYCDPQAVAAYYGVTREQAEFMWSVLETDPAKVINMLMQSTDSQLSAPFLTGVDYVSIVQSIWDAFDENCFDVTISEARQGVFFLVFYYERSIYISSHKIIHGFSQPLSTRQQ